MFYRNLVLGNPCRSGLVKNNQNPSSTANSSSIKKLRLSRLALWGGLGILVALGFKGSLGQTSEQFIIRLQARLPLRGELKQEASVTPENGAPSPSTKLNSTSKRPAPYLQALSDGEILKVGPVRYMKQRAYLASQEELFEANDGTRYFWVDAKDLSRVKKKILGEWFPNTLGRLQSASQQRSIDPGSTLQWHLFPWPNSTLDRFPHTVDQNFPFLRLSRQDEYTYWAQNEVPFVPAHPPRACSEGNPLSLNASRMWEGLPQDADLSRPAIILHDSLPDTQHFDLRGLVSLAPDPKGIRHTQETPDDHGTHVASLMSALRNDKGVTGVVPGLGILAYPLKTAVVPNLEKRVSLHDVLQGLGQIVHTQQRIMKSSQRKLGQKSPAERIRVVSLGYAFEGQDQLFIGEGTPLRDAIEALLRFDIAVVVPAGNSSDIKHPIAGTQSFPAAYARLAPQKASRRGVLISVSAMDVCAGRAWFSKEVPLISGRILYAPGERMYAAFPKNDLGYLSGTSQAAAQVAAILGLGATLSPDTAMTTLSTMLEETAKPLPHADVGVVAADAAEFIQSLSADFSRMARH